MPLPNLVRTIVVAALLSAAAAMPSVMAQEAYDLLFRKGTLDDIARDDKLLYSRDVTNTLDPEAAERDTGAIELTFADGTPEEARLEFLKDGKHRTLGAFPASVGNPMILYFVETVVRDMAETAGGSPFYIRNRVKASLIEPAEIEDGDANLSTTVTLRPFKDDPNAHRMKGFGDLALTVTMSEGVPGWYQSLAATVPGPDGKTVYSSVLTLERD